VTPLEEKRVLWISSDLFDSSQWPLISSRYEVVPGFIEEAQRELSGHRCIAVVLDFPAADWRTADFLEKVQALDSDIPVLVNDPGASPGDAVRLARLGAHQFLPGDEQAVVALLDQLRESRRGPSRSMEEWEELLVGDGPDMRQVRQVIRLVAERRSTVLVTGETGTGKELAARSLHLASQRRRRPWVAVNCSALPENLLEAELFGHVRGAFTGALQNRVGRFEQAQSGTLFLDEIGDLDPALQAKLLRAIQEREFQRLGSSETVPLNARLIAATNRDLPQQVAEGRFREDLYYRLNVVPIHMPPLRRRREDIPWLAAHFVEKICRVEEIPCKMLTSRAIAALCEYSWPGNVRQLENLLEMAIALSGSRELLDSRDFPFPAVPAISVQASGPAISLPENGMDYQRTVASIERSIIEQALQKTGGNKKAAAEMLGLKRTTLSAKVRSFEPGTALN
jgi:DNA-binding NtrC family response regulator